MKATINLTGDTHQDLLDALEAATSKINEEYIEGMDSNQSGSYDFTVEGQRTVFDKINVRSEVLKKIPTSLLTLAHSVTYQAPGDFPVVVKRGTHDVVNSGLVEINIPLNALGHLNDMK